MKRERERERQDEKRREMDGSNVRYDGRRSCSENERG